MKGLCSYCSRYFFCSKRPKQNEEDVILCSRFTQNNDNEETIWEQRRYEIAKDVAAGLVQRPNYIINEKCVTFMTEEPMDNIQSAEYFKENILPNEVEITHDDGNYFEVSVNCKSYSCDVYGNGDFYHSIAEFKLLED